MNKKDFKGALNSNLMSMLWLSFYKKLDKLPNSARQAAFESAYASVDKAQLDRVLENSYADFKDRTKTLSSEDQLSAGKMFIEGMSVGVFVSLSGDHTDLLKGLKEVRQEREQSALWANIKRVSSLDAPNDAKEVGFQGMLFKMSQSTAGSVPEAFKSSLELSESYVNRAARVKEEYHHKKEWVIEAQSQFLKTAPMGNSLTRTNGLNGQVEPEAVALSLSVGILDLLKERRRNGAPAGPGQTSKVGPGQGPR